MTHTLRSRRERRADTLRRGIATERARHALALVLWEAVADGIAFGPRDLEAQSDREWIRGAVAVPIQETAEVALDALVWRLADALAHAPNGLGERYVDSHEGVELGWD